VTRLPLFLTVLIVAGMLATGCRDAPPEAEGVRADRAIERAPGGGIFHIVRVAGEGVRLRFEPAELEIDPGDAVRFVQTRSVPVSVNFEPAGLPPEARDWAVEAGLPRGPLLTDPGAIYEVDFADAPPAVYRYLAPGFDDLEGWIEVAGEDD